MNEKSYFNRGKAIFLILIGILVLLMFPYFLKKMFTDNLIKQWESELIKNEKETDFTDEDDTEKTDESDKTDESKISDTLSKDVTAVVWDWFDYKSKHNKIKVVVKNADVKSAVVSRVNFFFINDWGAFYHSLHIKSLPAMKPLINAMKKDIKDQNLNYQQAMDYVVSSIQYIPYTLIASDNQCPCNMYQVNFKNDCSPRKDGRGCCNS